MVLNRTEVSTALNDLRNLGYAVVSTPGDPGSLMLAAHDLGRRIGARTSAMFTSRPKVPRIGWGVTLNRLVTDRRPCVTSRWAATSRRWEVVRRTFSTECRLYAFLPGTFPALAKCGSATGRPTVPRSPAIR